MDPQCSVERRASSTAKLFSFAMNLWRKKGVVLWDSGHFDYVSIVVTMLLAKGYKHQLILQHFFARKTVESPVAHVRFHIVSRLLLEIHTLSLYYNLSVQRYVAARAVSASRKYLWDTSLSKRRPKKLLRIVTFILAKICLFFPNCWKFVPASCSCQGMSEKDMFHVLLHHSSAISLECLVFEMRLCRMQLSYMVGDELR